MKTLNELIFQNEATMLVKAKRVTDNKWIMGYPVPIGDKLYILSEDDISANENSIVFNNENEVDKNTICHFTGKLTVKGEPVWEHDKIAYHFDENVIGVVRFGSYENVIPNVMHVSESHHGFYVDWPTKPSLRKDLGYWFDSNSMGMEVKGNLFD